MRRVTGAGGNRGRQSGYVGGGCGVGGGGGGGGTPGRRGAAPRAPLYFLDLPGYGYSRASKTERTAFRRLVTHALRRERLAGVVWLLDVRHEPSAGDRTMQDLLAAAGTRVLATVTKSDKLRRTPRLRREQELRETLGLDADQIIVTSARTGEGIEELREAIAGLIRESA